MNWDAITATVEIIGVVGFIVSIVCLGIQVRQSNAVTDSDFYRIRSKSDNLNQDQPE